MPLKTNMNLTLIKNIGAEMASIFLFSRFLFMKQYEIDKISVEKAKELFSSG